MTYPAEPERMTLRIGLLGTGFVAHFHLQALQAVRHVQVAGIHGSDAGRLAAAVQVATELGLGPCRGYPSIEELVADEESIDAIWILRPNFLRVPDMQAIAQAARKRSRPLLGVACEKPLARTLKEARELLRLADALADLPEPMREVVILKHCRGQTLQQIADHLGKTVPAVASLLRRGLEALRHRLSTSE